MSNSIYDFIDSIKPFILESLSDIRTRFSNIQCILYGSRAFNHYINNSFLEFNTYDYDFSVFSSDNINKAEEVANLLVSFLNIKAQNILIKHNFNYYFSTELSNYSQTYKIFVNYQTTIHKPIIDISYGNLECKELLRLYPPIIAKDGYYIQSFEWLIANLIYILSLETISVEDHIYIKSVQKAKMIIFQYNHFNLLNIKKTTQIDNLILNLSKLIKFNCQQYIEKSICDKRNKEFTNLQSSYMSHKQLFTIKQKQMQNENKQLIAKQKQMQNKNKQLIAEQKQMQHENKQLIAKQKQMQHENKQLIAKQEQLCLNHNTKLFKQEQYYQDNIIKMVKSQMSIFHEKEKQLDLKLAEFDRRITKSTAIVKLNAIERMKLIKLSKKVLSELNELESDNISQKLETVKQLFSNCY